MQKVLKYASSVRFLTSVCSLSSPTRRHANDAFGAFKAVRPRRVVVTGLGLVTPLGIGADHAWGQLINGSSGIRSIKADDIPRDQRAAFDGLPSKIAGMVDTADLDRVCSNLGVPSDSVKSARFIRLALAAAAEALQDAGWRPESLAEKSRTGVAIGSGMSATAELHTAAQCIGAGQPRRLSPFVVPRLLANMAAGIVSMQYGFLGPNHAASTACTTGAHSIGDAFNFIRHGEADVMIAGGTEACVDAISIGSFARMRALETRFNEDAVSASRPFDAGRGGFVMGEGAGMMLLEEMEHAHKRGATIYAEVRGYGLSADAHHITQPAPDGRGALLAMQRALSGSGVNTTDVAYINAHATSTPLGDAIEAAAIARMFQLSGEEVADQLLSQPKQQPVGQKGDKSGAAGATEGEATGLKLPLVSSTKGATGHLLGAAGAVEAVFTVQTLVHKVVPPTLNLEKPEPNCLGDSLIANRVCELRYLSRAAMSNSFGFGGTNASLLFTAAPV